MLGTQDALDECPLSGGTLGFGTGVPEESWVLKPTSRVALGEFLPLPGPCSPLCRERRLVWVILKSSVGSDPQHVGPGLRLLAQLHCPWESSQNQCWVIDRPAEEPLGPRPESSLTHRTRIWGSRVGARRGPQH